VAYLNKKLEAQVLLSQDISQIRVAELLKISRKTIGRWLKEPGFKEGIVSGRKAQLEAALARNTPSNNIEEIESCVNKNKDAPSLSEKLIAKSFAALDELLSNPETRTSDRLKGIEIVLRQCGGGAVADFGVQKTDDSQLNYDQRQQKIQALLDQRDRLAARKKVLEERGVL